MSLRAQKLPPRGAFILIGIAFMALGIANNTAFIGVGALFLIIGMKAVNDQRKAERATSEGEEARRPDSEG